MNTNPSNNKRSLLIKLVNEAIAEIEEEITKLMNGSEAIDDLQHLRFIKSVIIQIRSNMEMGPSMKNTPFEPNIARIVIDTWPVNDPLGNKICEIEYLYKKYAGL